MEWRPAIGCRRDRRRRGLTFIEILLATTVLAIASLVAFPTLLSFADLSDGAREKNVATHDLMTAVEDLNATPFAQVTTTYPNDQLIPKFERLHLSNETITVHYDDPAADPLLATLTVSWNDRKGHFEQETFRCVHTR